MPFKNYYLKQHEHSNSSFEYILVVVTHALEIECHVHLRIINIKTYFWNSDCYLVRVGCEFSVITVDNPI